MEPKVFVEIYSRGDEGMLLLFRLREYCGGIKPLAEKDMARLRAMGLTIGKGKDEKIREKLKKVILEEIEYIT